MTPLASRFRPFSSRLLLKPLIAAPAAVAVLLATAAVWAQAPTAPPAPNTPREIIITGNATTLAVPDCVPRGGDEAARTACQTITDVLRADLRFEDIKLVPDALYRDLPAFNPDALKFDDWKAVRAEILIVTRAEIAKGELVTDVRVYHVPTGQSIVARRFTNSPDKPRIVAHQTADEIMTLAQIKGVARSKIAFVSDRDTAPKTKKTKEIYIADYDGFGPRRLTVNRSLNILPSWSPEGKSLGYVSYKSGLPELLIAWIYEGRSSTFSPSAGSNIMSLAFSPDGKRVAYSSNKSGNADIWVANADGTEPRRITNSPAIDTAPSWSPSGNEIAFTSQRSGTPQIWVMDSDGLNPHKVSTYGNYNDAAAWNPAKEYSTEIAYTSRIEGGFEVAVVDVATGQVRQITEGRGSCEYPAWAPNGRHLACSCERGGRAQLAITDRMGRNVKAIDVGPGNNSQPDWGQ
jgi:TolB protein